MGPEWLGVFSYSLVSQGSQVVLTSRWLSHSGTWSPVSCVRSQAGVPCSIPVSKATRTLNLSPTSWPVPKEAGKRSSQLLSAINLGWHFLLQKNQCECVLILDCLSCWVVPWVEPRAWCRVRIYGRKMWKRQGLWRLTGTPPSRPSRKLPSSALGRGSYAGTWNLKNNLMFP